MKNVTRLFAVLFVMGFLSSCEMNEPDEVIVPDGIAEQETGTGGSEGSGPK